MEIRTQDLKGAALDWAVAKCEDVRVSVSVITGLATTLQFISIKEAQGWRDANYRPSKSWAQGGPIIEREGISVRLWIDQGWYAHNEPEGMDGESDSYVGCSGPTALIAAMRCYVASKMGEVVDIPKELL